MHAVLLAAAIAGFGEGSYRVSMITARQDGAHVGPLLGQELKFRRDALAGEVNVFGFFGPSLHGTLIGGEILHRVGLRGREPGFVTQDRPPKLFTRTEFALDLAPLALTHLRLTFGGGAGFDYDMGRWFPAYARAYPIVLARAQVFAGAFAIHLAYHFIPNTTNDSALTEHRVELGGSYRRFHLGARYARTRVVEPDGLYSIFDRELFAGYAF